MTWVRTVLGDIPPDQLGVCYAHEHLIIENNYATDKNPDFLLNDVDKTAAELRDAYALGLRAAVDSMPADAGRNVLKLAAVSRLSGVHVVCPTGLHLTKYYPPGHWSLRFSAEQMAALFAADIEQGVDANDYGAPIVERTAHRAGVIKIAAGRDRLSDHELKLFEAAAITHRQTRAPILTHTEEGTAGIEQIKTLQQHGVDLRHVCLSHLDRKPELGYHREILSTGVRVEYDSAFRWKPGETNHTFELLLALLPEFPDQMMLAMDAARFRYWKHYGGGPGMSYLLAVFAPRLTEAGITKELLQRVFVTTPADCYCFAA